MSRQREGGEGEVSRQRREVRGGVTAAREVRGGVTAAEEVRGRCRGSGREVRGRCHGSGRR